MNAILGMAELLEETPLNPDQKKFLAIMRNNGDALLALINDILDLAKVEAGRLTLERVDFDLEALTDKVVETLGVRAHAKGLELAVHLMPDVPRQLVGDPLRLRQILINLIGNAIKFTETGQVVLTVERDSAGAARRVALHRDRYRHRNRQGQARRGLRQLHPGRFLDHPPIRRQRARPRHRQAAGRPDGRANMGREQTGSGQRVSLHRPLRVSDAPRAVESATVALMLSGTRALVVDDNATNRLILREMLTSRGAEVGEAEDGPQGLALLERARLSGRPFKLLLLDCRMPGMDGFQLAERIKAAGYDGLPLLMLTSDDLKNRPRPPWSARARRLPG